MTPENLYKHMNSSLISIDIETKDPDLNDKGPGTHRGKGHICGLSVSSEGHGGIISDYLSFAHPDTPEEVRKKNRHYAGEILKTRKQKIGANIAYDVEWLEHEGFKVNGRLNDVQYAEPLLDEYRYNYKLNTLANHYLGRQKKSDVLAEYTETMGWSGKPIENIWRMPEAVASEYALVDSELPLKIFKKQKLLLEQQGLFKLYLMETDLIPFLLQMRKTGVKIDRKRFMSTVQKVSDIIASLEKELKAWAGSDINFGSVTQIAKVFDHYGIDYPRHPPTKKMLEKGITVGNPKLDKPSLMIIGKKHPICKRILDLRHYNTMNNLFLHKYANFMVGDRLYCQFHPLRNDDYGTVSGRFSCSKPNLQQVSGKKEENFLEDYKITPLQGKVIRKLFIPDDDRRWAKLDYSQVEYRLLGEYASGRGADELRESYRANKHMDYHQRIMDLTGFERGQAKNVNFGGAYGIGRDTAAKLFGWTLDEAEVFLAGYHRAAPYIRATRKSVSDTVSRRGYLMTLLKRRARLHPSRKLHSFFNRLIQGSAADVMKKALVDAYKQGIFKTVTPYMTVHDEIDVGFDATKEGYQALRELQHVMEHTVKIEVPLLVDCEIGLNWGELTEIDLQLDFEEQQKLNPLCLV